MKRPYEFLIRWDLKTGKVSGAHVGFGNVFIEDGQTHIGSIEPVEPVAIGKQKGFPLADILSQVQIAALTRCDELEQEKNEMEMAHAAALNEKEAEKLAAIEAERVAAAAALAEKDAELQNLRADVAPEQAQ